MANGQIAPKIRARDKMRHILPSILFFFGLLLFLPSGALSAVTVLVPSQPSVDLMPEANKKQGAKSGERQPEVDILFALLDVFENSGSPLDMPQLFASLRYDDKTPQKDGALQPERSDLLGDMEEISYLGHKAWGINIAFDRPGLYQFIAESRPRWDKTAGRFVQQTAKTILPVLGQSRGWDEAAGLRFEIVPLTRPFGLTAPALFSGRVMLNGKPLARSLVRMERINTDRKNAQSEWHKDMQAVTDAGGQFVFLLGQPGWWGCSATAAGDPMKGPDGQNSELELGALLWIYVDAPSTDVHKKQ